MDEPIWNPTVFTKNRDRLLNHEIAWNFFRRVVERAQPVMSDEHFTVDGTLIEAWASQKSFQRKDGGSDGDGRDFRGQSRTNDTHGSKTDPDSRLYRRSNQGEARLVYLGHLLIENRYGLIADAMATHADGYAEREAGLLMLHEQWRQAPGRHRTVGAVGYARSRHARPRIEPAFGWLKTIAWIRKVKLRGLAKVDWLFVFASAAFNLIRLPQLLPKPA